MIASTWSRVPAPRRPATVALLGLLVAAFGLRIYGWNWDGGRYLHPDERFVAMVMIDRIHLSWPPDWSNLFDPAESGLNPRSNDPQTGQPRSFSYGALPLIVTDGAAQVLNWLTGTDWHGYDRIYRVGRFLSAFLDTLTVLLVYLIGTRMANRRVGLLGAAIVALAPMMIQLAHFFTTDSWVSFFTTLALYWTIVAAESGRTRWFALAGFGFGLAVASKGSAASFAAVLALALIYDVWRRWRAGDALTTALMALPERIAVAGLCALAGFALFEPYALLRLSVYRASLTEQAAILSGAIDVPYTRQFIGTTPVLYQTEQIVRWGMGPAAGILGLIGLPVLLWRLWRRRTAPELLLLAWLAAYVAVIAVPEAKFLRYLAPAVPVLGVAGAVALDGAWSWLARRFNLRLATGLACVALVAVALWTAAFESVYARENSRVAASEWIYANVPAGSQLSGEYWDDPLPYDVGPGLTRGDRQYGLVQFNLYADYIPWRDLLNVASAFDRDDLTRPAARAIRDGDPTEAASVIRKLGDGVAALTTEQRNALAATLDQAANDLSPQDSALGDSLRRAAGALRGNDPTTADSLRAVGDTLQAAGDNEAANVLYQGLQQADYYVLSSNRVSSAMPHSPWRYPVQIRFYQLLASGQLGYSLVADIARYPKLGPISFPDDSADESFINYDHPHVLIYKKDSLVAKPQYDALMAEARAQPISSTRHQPKDLMLDQPVGSLPVVNDARWSSALTRYSGVALAVWVVLLLLLQAAGWPLARLAFGRFADGGWSFARLISWLLAGYVVWIGASTAVISFRAIWCGVALALVLGVGWLARLRHWGGHARWAVTPAQRRAAIAGEVVFWAVFGLFLLYRYLNPDSWHPVWGGEKPMEFAHINATLRSAHFPPYDPWFAGGYINYYYYGLYLVAYLLKLTGIPSEIGFNLAQPTVIALLALGGYGIAASLGRDASRLRRAAIPAGVLGTLLLVGIGNLDAFLRWFRGQDDGGGFGTWVWAPSRAIAGAITEFPYFTALYADLHAHVVALMVTTLAIAAGYALAADPRAVALALAAPQRNWSAVAGVVARFGLLALTLASLTGTNAWDVPTYGALGVAALFMATGALRPWWRRGLVWAGASAVLAALSYGLFLPFFQHYVALFSQVARVRQPTQFWQFTDHLGGPLAIAAMGLVTVLVARSAGAAGPVAQPLTPLLILGIALAGRQVVPADNTRLRDALGAAVAVVPAVTLLAAAWAAAGRARGHRYLSVALRAGFVAVGLIAAIAATHDRLVLGLMLIFAAAAGAVWLLVGNRALRFAALLVGGACLIAAGTEVVFLADDLKGGDYERMNTIFKFYNQVWVLLALGGAALVARMAVEAAASIMPALGTWWGRQAVLGAIHRSASVGAERSRPVGAQPQPLAEERVGTAAPSTAWSQAGVVVAALAIIAGLFYPILATHPRLEQRFTAQLGSGTLNALDWMTYGRLGNASSDCLAGPPVISFADDLVAINWFNTDVAGSPVIAEASFGPYRCDGSRFSIATGLPDIIGWDRHERQQRYPSGIDERSNDVRTLYDSADPAIKLDILRRYDVRYVIVGDLERLKMIDSAGQPSLIPWASAAGIAAFQQMVGSSLEVAFQHGSTTVYRVLAPASGGATTGT